MPPLNFMRPELQCSACLLATGHARAGAVGRPARIHSRCDGLGRCGVNIRPQIPVQADARRDLPRLTAGTNNLSGIFACVFCEFFGFAQFPFGLIPKLLVSPGGTAIFVPDFPGANSNVLFIGFHQCQRPRFQFFNQFQYSPAVSRSSIIRVRFRYLRALAKTLATILMGFTAILSSRHKDRAPDLVQCRSAARSARAGWFRMSGSGGLLYSPRSDHRTELLSLGTGG